jgi:hypothetical protein
MIGCNIYADTHVMRLFSGDSLKEIPHAFTPS